MAWKKEVFGILENGAQADKYILTNKNGVSAAFTNLGGIWLSMIVPDKNGNMGDVLLGRDTVDRCLTLSGHLGEIVGRNANRIGDATFTLNGVTYALGINSANRNNLHSGPDYYRSRLWDTKVEDTDDGTKIIFSLFSPDGDQGYPGNADISVSYTLTEDNGLRLDYYMKADADTVANFTWPAMSQAACWIRRYGLMPIISRSRTRIPFPRESWCRSKELPWISHP